MFEGILNTPLTCYASELSVAAKAVRPTDLLNHVNT